MRANTVLARNVYPDVVESFGREWQTFDQSGLSEQELRGMFDEYFEIFPWSELPADAVGYDLGCGTGRWARFVAPRVGELHCVEPRAALEVARRNLAAFSNSRFHAASVADWPLADASMDFGFSLGVLHHVPDTLAGIRECVRKLKPGAPFLLYLYYSLENRPAWYRAVWRTSDVFRRAISRAPAIIKNAAAATIAASVYWPLARTARWLERHGARVDHLPLAAYRGRSFYIMRNDALDRFGTRVERRFSRAQVEDVMRLAGLERIRFSEKAFWCAVGYRRS